MTYKSTMTSGWLKLKKVMIVVGKLNLAPSQIYTSLIHHQKKMKSLKFRTIRFYKKKKSNVRQLMETVTI
jgi:replicative DNA helicase